MSGKTRMTKGDRSLTFERTFDAPRQRLFDAFADRELLMKWWGPKGAPVVECTLDFVPGGIWHYCLRNARGGEHWARSVFQEIVRPAKIVYVENSSDSYGRIVDELPTALVTVTFDEADGQTLLRSYIRYHSLAERDRMAAGGIKTGFSDALDFLEELVVTRSHPTITALQEKS